MTALYILATLLALMAIAAGLIVWAFTGNWYSVAGTEIERDIWEGAEREEEGS